MNTLNALKSFEQQVNDIVTGAVELDEFEHEARSRLGRIELESWGYSYTVSRATGCTSKKVFVGRSYWEACGETLPAANIELSELNGVMAFNILEKARTRGWGSIGENDVHER